MMLIVSLLTTATMADDGVAIANRTSAQHGRSPVGPGRFRVALPIGKWDKENRSDGDSAARVATCPDLKPKAESSPPIKNLNWERISLQRATAGYGRARGIIVDRIPATILTKKVSIMAKIRALYQLRITLQDIQPTVWRQIQVQEDITMGKLHDILQVVMNWEDYHLHEFTIGRRLYSVPDQDDDMNERKVIDERRERLCDAVPRVGTQFLYLYDFGDNWRHDLLLEAILLPESSKQYPRCIAGERRTPPEDVGGTHGYEEYLEAIADPEHEEHENVLRWRGPFDPEAFSPDEVNQRLRKGFRSAGKTANPKASVRANSRLAG